MNKSSHLPFFGTVKNSRRILEAILMAFVLLICFITQINAQISGTIFMDGNNNGIYESATEVPFAFVTVKATDAAGNMFTSTSATNGTYTIAGTNSTTMYRVEFSYPDGYLDGAQATGSGSSVQFALGNATNVNQGVYVANTCDPDGTMRVMFSSGLDSDATDFGLRSWDYTADRRAVNMMGSAGTTTPHTDDIPITAAGVAYGIAVQKGTNLGFFTTISSDLTSVFPADPVGEDVIRVANYSGAGNTYVSNKLLVDLSAFGISTAAISPSIDGTFGTHGLGGIAISDDGKTLYAINMGKRNLIKIDISGINYATIPVGGYTGAPLVVTEIALPNASCTNGTYRPGALDFHAGNLYIGGVCDANSGTAANLQVKAYEMNPITNAFTQVLSYTPNWLTAGLRLGGDWPHAPWSTTYPSGDNDGDPGAIQPHFFSIAFDDYGAMIIGFVNREVFVNAGSTREPGYLLRTWRNSDGTFTLESGGVSGPLTSTARTRNVDAGAQPGNFTPNPPSDYNNGPGNDWFFENGRTRSHPNLYTGGALVVPGTGYVVGGFADPGNPIYQTGGRYINFETGRSEYGTSVIGAKATVMAAGDVVCDDPTVEIGNRVFMDTDGDGIQDGNEMAIAGVTVQLYNGASLVSTAVTDANGNYIFSTDPLGTTTSSFIYNLSLVPGINYTLRIPNVQGANKQSSLGTKMLTTPNLSGTTNTELDKIDSDGLLVGNNADVTFLLVAYGANNHTLDFGFTALACPTAGTDGTTTVCDNSTLTITLSSLITGDSTGGTWSRVTGTGGTFNATLGTFVPTGATTSTFRYIVSAAGCPNDTANVNVSVNTFRTAGTDGSVTECDGSLNTVNLFNLITGEQTGGTWSRLTGTGGVFNSGAGTFQVTVGTTTSTFRYIMTGTSPCPNDTSVATVTITAAPTAGTGSSTTVCETSTTTINLFNLLTGENTGGTWSRLTGTGGTFNAGAGTYIPAIGATTSIFRYIIGGSGCPFDTADVNVNITPQPTAGVDGTIDACAGGGVTIDLFSVITGEQTGGTWSRISGSGGTFDPIAGSFSVTIGATSSTFRYIILGTSPCINDTSIATVNVTGLCCMMDITQTTVNPCNSNGTYTNPGDDYFTVTLNATNIASSAPFLYEVYYNGNLLGTSSYGTPITIGTATLPPFKPDGVSTYKLYVRDRNLSTCVDSVIIGPVTPCPILSHSKILSSITNLNDRDYRVVYNIQVTNVGGPGSYGLTDLVGFDDDISILASSYTTNAPGNSGNPGPQVLSGLGPWTLASSQSIASATSHNYTLTVDVRIDLSSTSLGNNIYTPCAPGAGGTSGTFGQGLFNQSSLDNDSDGDIDEVDDACGDLPYIIHEKTYLSTTQTGPRNYRINYQITVRNLGGVSGTYELVDQPNFDSDIIFNSSNYTSDAPGNIANPGPFNLIGTGPWTFASNQSISAGSVHTYTLSSNVTINLEGGGTGDDIYRECGDLLSIRPSAGEGAFNQSSLNYDLDPTPEELDTACVDLPYIVHNKTIQSVTDLGSKNFRVVYQIRVDNLGGASGSYNLTDIPGFEDDFQITSASYTSNALGNPANPGPITLATSGSWILASDQLINAGQSQIFTITVEASIDLVDIGTVGDEIYRACGSGTPGIPSSGEGLFNRSTLDVNDDGIPEQIDTVCADVKIWDLALRKILLTNPPYTYGQTVQFEITVFNQGNETANNIEVKDYIPTGYSFSPNNGWIGAAPLITKTITTPVLPRDSAKILLNLVISQTGGGAINWINYSEISGSQDLTNTNRSLDDIDSRVNSDGLIERAVLPNSINDNNIFSQNIGGEEDDHDPDGIQIYDLALKKTKINLGPYTYGMTVPFTITIYNQGSIASRNIRVVDYIPSGFTFNLGANPGWTGGVGTAEYLYTNTLNPGDSASLILNLTVSQVTSGDFLNAWTNYAEIKSSENLQGVDMTNADIDSDADGTNANDPGGRVESPADNYVNGTGTGAVGDGIAATDEDDHDPERIKIWDLALKKLYTSGTIVYGSNLTFTITVYNQGNDTVRNVVIRDYIPLGYSFSAGSNPAWSGTYPNVLRTIAGPIAPGDSANVTIVLTVENNPGGILNWVNYAEIISSQDNLGNNRSNDDIDSNVGSNTTTERNVLPGSINDNNITSTNKGGEEDDHDPAGINIFDLALKKTTVNKIGPFNYGDVIPFTITVYNQGNKAATNIEIIDYIPSGFSFGANPSWNISSNIASTIISGPLAPGDSTSVTINLIVQVPADGNYLNAWYNEAEINRAIDEDGVSRIDDIDGYFDNNKNNDNDVVADGPDDNEINEDRRNMPLEDEDDNDPEQIRVWDLALRKINTSIGSISYGQDIIFNIKVFNQGNEAARNVRVTDYIPKGYSFQASSNPGWIGTYPNLSYTIAGPIAPGDSSSINLILVLENTSGGTRDWVNYAEITSSENLTGADRSTYDADSYTASNTSIERTVMPGSLNDNNITSINKGGEEDDHDPAGVDIYDLALKKTKTISGPFEYGQNIPFTLTIYNQGNISARNIRVVDYIPNGFSFNNSLNPGWTGGIGMAEYLYVNTLLPGDSAILSINLTTQPVTSNFTNAWTNYAEIKSSSNLAGVDMTFSDIDSDADMNINNDAGGQPESPADNFVNGDGSGIIGDNVSTTDEDDHDPERVRLWDLALRKVMITSGTLTYGQDVVFRITVYNQGNDTATNVVVGDYVPEGYNYSSASNPSWTGTYPIVSYTISGPIAPGDSAMITLVLELKQSNGGTKDWVNYSEILSSMDASGTNRSNHDADSEVGSNNVDENAVLPGGVNDNNILSNDKFGEEDDHDPAGPRIYDLALIKKPVTSGPYSYNQSIEFKIWVYNQGNIAADEIQVVDYIPVGFEFDNSLSSPIWAYNSITRKATTLLNTVLAAGDSASVSIYLRLVPTTGGTSNWINYGEILSSQDDSGINMTNSDIDSNPNSIQSDDPGGRPLTIDDDNNSGDGRNGGDEDDHDPALIEVIDLALRKTLETTTPYTYGQNHDYRLVVFNQGNEYMQNVKVIDYIPNGYTFLPALNIGWNLIGSNVEFTIPGPLVPGDSAVLNLILRLDQTTGDIRNWVNYAEITSMEDTASISRTNDDIDSNPQSDNPTERDVFPGEPEDNNIISIDKGGEEDDHDPAGPSIFDLAQKKWTIQTGPFKYNDLVTFNIRVFNQGNEPASNIEITDYVPCGFEFAIAGNSSWAYNTVTRKATRTIGSSLLPGDSTTITIILKVIPCANNEENAWTNISEISAALDSYGKPGEDIDSNPNSDESDDTGGNPDSPDDDKIDGDSNLGEDEDDHDPARIELVDLALRKTLVTTSPYRYGDVLDFNIMVKNQGNVPMQNVQIQDYIPSGFSFSPSLNLGWTGSNPLVSRMITTRINPGDSVILPLRLTLVMTSGSEKAYINYAEITQIVDTNLVNRNTDEADSRPGSDGPAERDVEPGFLADNDISSIDKGGEEDDHDPAGIEVFDLAQKKWTTQTGPFRYNDLVTFNIRVYNQGSMAANTIELTDYIPCGYEFVNASNPSWILDPLNSIAKTTIAGLIVPGDSMTVQIVLKVIPCYTNVNRAWTNYSEISIAKDPSGNLGNDIDSNPNSNPGDDTGGEPNTSDDDKITGDSSKGEDEDDHDPAQIEVVDVAIKKELITPTPYSYGQLLEFKVTIYNQGNIPVINTLVEDHIPIGFSYSPADNPGWMGTYPEVHTIYTQRINPGQSASLTLRLRLLRTLGGRRDWINYSEIAAIEDTTGIARNTDDADSNPNSDLIEERQVVPNGVNDDNIFSNARGGEEDDHDPAGPSIFDLAQRKTVVTAGPYTYGQEVDFKITVFNQGNVTAQNVLITDYIPSGFAFVSAYGWTFDGVNKATQTITSTITPGDSSSLLIKLRVLPNPSSSTAYVNVAEISGATDTTNTPRVDIDSNPDGNPGNDGDPVDDAINDPNDEDDHDPSRIDVYDLALRKVITTPPTYTYGQNLNFRIRVYNQGTLPVTNTVVEDYIPVGYTYLSSLNPLWTGAAPTVSYTHVPVLNPGDSFEINLILQLSRTDGGATDWINYSEISSMRDVTGVTDVSAQDVDSDPNGDTAGEREVTPGSSNDDNITDITKSGDQDDHDPAGIEVYDLALRKQFKGTYPLRYGDIIAYEIKIFNQGNIDATNIFVSDYIPQGYSFNPIENPNWVYDPITRIASTTFSNVVIAGDSAAVSINLTLEQFTGDRSAWKNIAEIETSEDTNGNPKEDIDSTPDQVVDNDGNPVDDAIHDPNDEDDHDPAEVEVLDIALRKWVPNEKPYYVPGEEVDFVISLHNQGNVVSSSIVVKDYLPNGFTFVAASNPGWTLVGSNLEYDYNTRLYPTDSVQLHLKLIVIIPASNVTLSSWENYAEIFSVRDTSGVLRSTDDADSFAGSDTPYERSVHDNDPYDEVIDGTGIVLLPNEDEDDHDPEAVVVTAYLGDKVWKDLDGDGVQDAGEMPLRGVYVTIYDCATGAVVQRDTTDINGNYGFEGLFGDKDYYVRFDASPLGMPNCAWTFKDRGGNDRTDSDVNASGITDCTRLDWGERDSTVDAGFVELAAYGDYVWHDRDVDGQQEFGEEGIGGVTVTLYDAATNQIVRTGITDNNGQYFFDKLMPMQYYAKYTRPAGYGDTDFNRGSDVTDNDVDASNGAGTNATTYLSPGETDRTWDYGVYKCSCISGDVWYDLNKDGIYQDIENGINGLSVYLVNAMTGDVVASAITGPKPGTPSDDGYYSFCSCLRPGMYYVRYDRPGDLAASSAFQGTDRTKDSHLTHAYGPNTSEKITVLSGSDIKDINAGFQVKAVVGNYVWLDGNQNGLQDSGEKPVQGVKVAAYNTAGVMVSESTTGVDGKYLLDGIAAGDYYVKFVPSSQYGFTSANRGNDDIDSDVTGTQGLGTTQVMRLNTGDAIPHVDAGLILSVLPIEWIDFTAEYNGSFTELNWSTGTEINNSHFEIERRHESEKDFEKIGQESASTNASAALHEYSHDDYDVVKSGLYYYRIKQIDRDGKYSYSKIKTIKKLKANDLSVYIYPNPVRDLLKVEIDLSIDEEVIVDVVDANGKVVMHQPFGGRMKAGRSNKLLNTESLTSGNYVIRIKTSQTVVSKKFTVAK